MKEPQSFAKVPISDIFDYPTVALLCLDIVPYGSIGILTVPPPGASSLWVADTRLGTAGFAVLQNTNADEPGWLKIRGNKAEDPLYR